MPNHLTIPDVLTQPGETKPSWPAKAAAMRACAVRELPRGIRNNNPGNVRADPDVIWHGQVGIDPDGFLVFVHPAFGIRCACIVMRNYHKLHWCNTVTQYMYRWAPPQTNNTDAYVKAVARYMDLDEHATFNLSDRAEDLCKAIIIHENGYNPYPEDLIRRGVHLSHKL